MNIIANVLSDVASEVADTATSACLLFMWDEPVAPEEIL